MSQERFPYEEFKIEFPSNGGVAIGLVASGRSGKTTFLSHVLSKYFKKHLSVLFTGSPQIEMSKTMGESMLMTDRFIPRITQDMYKINKETGNHYNFCVILDDIVTEKNNKEVLKCWTIYRNSWISSIISVQDVTLWNPAGRNNITIVMLGKLNTDDRIEKTIKAYLKSYFPSGMRMIDMIKEYKEMTANHHFIVIDQLRERIYRTKCNLDED